jgi:secreted trypsin-like serine protease
MSNDVALLALGRAPRGATPIPLANGSTTDGEGEAFGWGPAKPGASLGCLLQRRRAVVLGNGQCRHGLGAGAANAFDPASEFCADVRPDSCQGSSGGPLYARQHGKPVVLGTMSWGVGCGAGTPVVFAAAAKLFAGGTPTIPVPEQRTTVASTGPA